MRSASPLLRRGYGRALLLRRSAAGLRWDVQGSFLRVDLAVLLLVGINALLRQMLELGVEGTVVLFRDVGDLLEHLFVKAYAGLDLDRKSVV